MAKLWSSCLEVEGQVRLLLSGNSAAHILSAGFVSGMTVTGLLNPYDRALFLSVRAKRPFLSASNWTTPFHGVYQTLVSKTLSTGMYFPLEEFGRSAAHQLGLEDGRAASSILAGNFAGAVNALVLSPLAAVKYMSWGERKGSVVAAATATYERGGLPAFFVGFHATVCRDMTFGAFFALLRSKVRRVLYHSADCETPLGCFVADAIASGCAAIASSPFNYARQRQFAYHANDHIMVPSIFESLTYFMKQLAKRDTLFRRLKYAQTRLMIGWGTLRVAAGMGLSALIYDALC